MRILELGCGPEKVRGAIAVDINPHSAADVLADLNKTPWPFKADVFDRVICSHVLEHLDDLVNIMEEIYRISRPGATVQITVPFFSSVYAHSDVTHRHLFSTRSFNHFIQSEPVSRFRYSNARFEKICARIVTRETSILRRFVSGLINKYSRVYEERFAYIFPRHEIYFELRVLK